MAKANERKMRAVSYKLQRKNGIKQKKRVNEQIINQINEWMSEWTNARINELTCERKNERTSE